MTLVALSIIAIATLRGGDPRDAGSAWCIVCPPRGSRVGVDLILNVLLFIPYGFGLGAMRVPRLRAGLIVVLTTLLVEFLQMYVVPGRYSSVADVVTNSAGGILGMALAHQSRSLIDPAVSRARSLALVGLAAWFALIAGSSIAATPSLPERVFSVRWRPDSTGAPGTDGVLLAARIGGVPLPPGPRGTHDSRLDAFRRGEPTQFEAVLLPALPDGANARLEILADGRPTRVVLAQDGDDAILRVHLRASDARLRGPTLRLAGALASRRAAGRDTAVLTGLVSRRLLRVESANDGTTGVRELVLGPHLGWSFLLPGRTGLPSMARALADGLWLTFLLIPIGYWARRSTGLATSGRVGPPLVSLGIAAVCLGLGLWGIPTAIGVAPAPFLAWGLGIALLVAGWIVAGATARRSKGDTIRS